MKKIWWLPLMVFITLFGGCKKDKCKGGSGGGLTIVAKTMHHTRLIKGCKAYIKYNATEFPGEDPAAYDMSFQIDSNKTEAVFGNLKCGDYYLYAKGIDSLLDPSTWVVKGGIPFSTSQGQGSVTITIPITEGD